jgi:hypothetical protein
MSIRSNLRHSETTLVATLYSNKPGHRHTLSVLPAKFVPAKTSEFIDYKALVRLVTKGN